MPKDSVQILCGKPDQVDLNTIGDVVYEDWGGENLGHMFSKRFLQFFSISKYSKILFSIC